MSLVLFKNSSIGKGMTVKKLNDNKYQIRIYNSENIGGEQVIGNIQRFPDADEHSDKRYFMFYPCNTPYALTVKDLWDLANMTEKLNKENKLPEWMMDKL